MSDPIDTQALDEYLERGSEVSQHYRELGGAEVPRELDRRVLAAAREAVASDRSRRSRSWMRWSAPVALAASVVLALTVFLERGVHDETVPLPHSPGDARGDLSDVGAVRSDAAVDDDAATESDAGKVAEQFARQPGFVQAPPAAPPPRAMPASPRAEAAAKAEAQAVTGTQSVAPAAADQITARKSLERSAAQEAESPELNEIAIAGSRSRRATVRTAGPRGTIATGAFTRAQPASADQPDQSDPQAWLEDIRAMRRAGKTAEADREWQRFREAFPDFQVADDDIARKQP